MTRTQKLVAGALILVGLLAALWVAVGRAMVEQTNRTVGIAVDWEEVRALSAAAGVTPTKVLGDLRAAGATHLAIPEMALSDVVARGEAALFTRGDVVEIWADDPGTLHQISRGLGARYPYPPGTIQRTEAAAGENWLSVPTAAVTDMSVGVGYPREAAEAASTTGLIVVARPRYQGVRTAEAADRVVRAAAEIGAKLVVFAGDMVAGYPGNLQSVAFALRDTGMEFGFIELVPQLGASELAMRLHSRIVRVHSITDLEMRVTSMDRALDRFTRAAREREVRLLYLRMFPSAPGGVLVGNAQYVEALLGALRGNGYRVGAPEPLAAFSTAPWVLALVMLGLYGGLLWLIQALFALPGRWFWWLAGLMVVAGTVKTLLITDLVRSMAALAVAVIFPILSVGYTALGATAQRDEGLRLRRAVWPLIGGFLSVAAVTAMGGLLVVGMLGDTAYLTQIAQFRGVKLAQVLPLLVIALLWLARSMPAYRERLAGDRPGSHAGPEMVDYHTGDGVAEWPALWAGLREALGQVIRYWHVALALVGLAALAMLVIRSGNEAGGAVLPGEQQLRALLDRLLVVRPRTKEVFLGHPVLILALLLALRRVRPGLWIAFAVGAIGQVSLLNSFCHTHTPLLMTVLRVFNGLWIGAIGGLILCALWDRLGGAPKTVEQPALELEEETGDDEEP